MQPVTGAELQSLPALIENNDPLAAALLSIAATSEDALVRLRAGAALALLDPARSAEPALLRGLVLELTGERSAAETTYVECLEPGGPSADLAAAFLGGLLADVDRLMEATESADPLASSYALYMAARAMGEDLGPGIFEAGRSVLVRTITTGPPELISRCLSGLFEGLVQRGDQARLREWFDTVVACGRAEFVPWFVYAELGAESIYAGDLTAALEWLDRVDGSDAVIGPAVTAITGLIRQDFAASRATLERLRAGDDYAQYSWANELCVQVTICFGSQDEAACRAALEVMGELADQRSSARIRLAQLRTRLAVDR